MHADFKELLRALNDSSVRYLIVGGYAVMEYTEPRFTKDLDILIATDAENAAAVYRALAQYGAPLESVSPEDFTEAGYVYQIGITPVRIDILMSIEGVAFEEAWSRRVERRIGDVPVYVISREDLIRNKRAVARPQDRIDVRRLEAVGKSTRRRGAKG